MKILDIFAREILDSRGQPTIEVDLQLQSDRGSLHFGRASVPSGASVGSKEAVELRDGRSERYLGCGVLGTVNIANHEIRNSLLNKVFDSQSALDQFLIHLDGTPNKLRLGANNVLAISLAFAKARSCALGLKFFESIDGEVGHAMPCPMFNILNGGVHADNGLAFQEFMIVPSPKFCISDCLEIAYRIFMQLRCVLKKNGYSVGVGDEGGFAPHLSSIESALDLLVNAIIDAGFAPGIDCSIALDVAANEIYKNGRYCTKDALQFSTEEFAEYYISLVNTYPIISIEDPFAESDMFGWQLITKKLGGKIQIVGDDIFVTNVKMLEMGVSHGIANAILIKLNQVGTLTETLDAIKLARSVGYNFIISHRSGETEDVSISHIAVATASTYIKAGSICRTDRVCKYNELLRIDEVLRGVLTSN